MTFAVDRLMISRGLLPPLFCASSADARSVRSAALRRAAGATVLVLVLWLAVFSPLGSIGTEQSIDFNGVATPQLFLVHGMLAAALAAWYCCGFVGSHLGHPTRRTQFGQQFGLSARRPAAEFALGLGAGVAAWILVLLILIAVGAAIWILGGEEALPTKPPPILPWIASLPLVVRLAVSASAGFFEELFFRGFLQPRVGIPLSTALFVLAHASYEQPLMLVGITVLSLIFAFLVKWRQNIWSAVVAHTVFDAIQLIFVIPTALKFIEGQV